MITAAGDNNDEVDISLLEHPVVIGVQGAAETGLGLVKSGLINIADGRYRESIVSVERVRV